MNITPIEMQLNSEDFSETVAPRSPGLHLSSIIYELDKIAHGDRYPDSDPSTKQAYFSVGFIWEQILSHLWRETALKYSDGVLIRPGEFSLDGIAMSPDAVDLGDLALEEYKATYLSSSNAIDGPKFWHWLVQIKCYCKAIGTLKARLRVWFIVGDWKGSGPQVRAWQFEFTQQEIDETWQMVTNSARAKGWI